MYVYVRQVCTYIDLEFCLPGIEQPGTSPTIPFPEQERAVPATIDPPTSKRVIPRKRSHPEAPRALYGFSIIYGG